MITGTTALAVELAALKAERDAALARVAELERVLVDDMIERHARPSASDRICSVMVQNADGEDYVEVVHTVSAYFAIRSYDEHGKETASIDLDYPEARAVAFALSNLVKWHADAPEQNGDGT